MQDGDVDSARQISRLWMEIVDDIQRADANLPAEVEVTELHIPKVTQQPGGGVTVTVPIRQGVDLQR